MVKKRRHQSPEHIRKRVIACAITMAKEGNQLLGRKRPPFSEEWKRHMSEGRKNLKPSEETRQKMSKALTGRPCSEYTLKKISVSLTGRKRPNLFSEEAIKRMVERGKKRPNLAEHMMKMHRAAIKKGYPRISRPQQELFWFLKQIFLDAKKEYPIKTKENHTNNHGLLGYRFADIGIPSLKIDFEYDGFFTYNRHSKEENEKRDLELASVGWITFRVNKEILRKLRYQEPQKLADIRENIIQLRNLHKPR